MYNYFLTLIGFLALAAICAAFDKNILKKTTNEPAEQHTNRKWKIILLVLAGYTIVSAFQLSSDNIATGLRNFNTPDTKQVTVKGTAAMNVVSDLAVWTAHIQTESISLKDGYNQMITLRDQIQNYLQTKDIHNDSIQFSLINKTEIPNYEKFSGDGANRIRTNKNEFRFSQNITITYPDVHKIQKLAADINELLTQEINITSYPPNYLYSKLDSAKIILIKKAEQDAKNRALAMGLKVNDIVNASQGIFQITPRNTTAIEDNGMNDMTSIDKTIKSVVTISYEIK